MICCRENTRSFEREYKRRKKWKSSGRTQRDVLLNVLQKLRSRRSFARIFRVSGRVGNKKDSTKVSEEKDITSVSLCFAGMEQFEQLLTCAICLDRYRNPKLLPCQHSFCMEPCMDGLVDYVRRQVKCPECRAEHRIPYQVSDRPL